MKSIDPDSDFRRGGFALRTHAGLRRRASDAGTPYGHQVFISPREKHPGYKADKRKPEPKVPRSRPILRSGIGMTANRKKTSWLKKAATSNSTEAPSSHMHLVRRRRRPPSAPCLARKAAPRCRHCLAAATPLARRDPGLARRRWHPGPGQAAPPHLIRRRRCPSSDGGGAFCQAAAPSPRFCQAAAPRLSPGAAFKFT